MHEEAVASQKSDTIMYIYKSQMNKNNIRCKLNM
jgi:hypothetical protein